MLPLLPVIILHTVGVLRGTSAASHHNCNGPLASALPDSSFHASSQSSAGYAAFNARLNRRDGAGGWSPLVTDQDPWLQVDLREQMEVTAVATQGRHDSWDWVSSYLLLHSDTGRIWKQYRQEDGVERFVGNVNSEAVVHNKLSHPVRTRFLRFVPLDWNPSGWMGLRVEVFGCSYKSYVADFDGRSSLLYRFNQKSMSTVKDVISLRFKSHQAEGVLLHGEGQRGDYITLELHRGRLDLYLNLDDSRPRFSSRRVAVTVGSLLDDQHWHSVHIERFNKQVNLTVDSHTQHFQTKGEGHSLEVDYELSFGGIPLPGKPGTFLRRNFHGCMENLYYNGINIIDLAKRRKPQIHSVGNVTFSCSQHQVVACTFLSSSSSFLSLPSAAPTAGEFSVGFQFRTWNPDGLLLSVQLSPSPQKLELLISNSWLHLTLHSAGRQRTEVSAGRRVNDGLWHSVGLSTGDLQVALTLDGEPSSSMELWERVESRSSFYFGGCRPRDCLGQTPAFQGCMQLIFINNQLVNLSLVQQGILGNYNQLQFDTCNMKDRCLPNLCEHGARCSQTWSSFSCDCSGTGYSGATCHNSIYESSCEAYKLSGSSSGFYFIDPDGSGPLGPAQVYCNMTEKKVWTVLSHNSTAPVKVQGSSPQKPHIMKLSYNASSEQLRAIVSGSEQCQQEVVYSCRKSRLFNTKDGSPLSWWLDRDGERRSYWGGFLPGVQQCSCSLEENCLDMNYFCNCDADTDSWANDTGVLSYKDHLPVSQVVIGDANRTGSQAVYRVGALRCYGDSRVHMERSVLLPGVLLPLLPHPAGGAGLRYLLLLQDQHSLRSVSGEPGPEGLHPSGAQLSLHRGVLLRRGERPRRPGGEVSPAPERPAVALREGGAQREGGVPAGGPAAPAPPAGPGRRTPPPKAKQPVVCRGNGVPAEGLPGLHQVADGQRRGLRPGGAGQDDAWGERRLPRILQRLQQPLPQPGPVRGEEQRLHLRLLAVGLRRDHLQPGGVGVLRQRVLGDLHLPGAILRDAEPELSGLQRLHRQPGQRGRGLQLRDRPEAGHAADRQHLQPAAHRRHPDQERESADLVPPSDRQESGRVQPCSQQPGGRASPPDQSPPSGEEPLRADRPGHPQKVHTVIRCRADLNQIPDVGQSHQDGQLGRGGREGGL
ncbi:contactin-associated protein-like 5 isoform 4-T7 [Odontesthes bonariensis]|uniref:contactin-associated protein-like 5 isoform X4 n=1 Tax=Odontesthes bonariensis TaxID=219752 RepID=UPI003F586D98